MAKAPADLRSLARSFTEEGVRILGGIAKRGKSEPARVAAVGLLLERGWGKAPQNHEVDGDIRITIRSIIESADKEAMKEVTALQPLLTIENDENDN